MVELLPIQIKNITEGIFVLPRPPLFYTLNPVANTAMSLDEEEKEQSDNEESTL